MTNVRTDLFLNISDALSRTLPSLCREIYSSLSKRAVKLPVGLNHSGCCNKNDILEVVLHLNENNPRKFNRLQITKVFMLTYPVFAKLAIANNMDSDKATSDFV